jgi:hypothetical protein
MANPDRQEAGHKGGSMRQKRLRAERARDAAREIVGEMDRRAWLHNSAAEPLSSEQLQPLIDVIATMLQDVVKPYPSRRKPETINGNN